MTFHHDDVAAIVAFLGALGGRAERNPHTEQRNRQSRPHAGPRQ
jgi:hypothetical protein